MKLDSQTYLIFDGAMGTMLQNHGSAGEIPEVFHMSNPEIIENVHKQYIEAGSDVITANTFGAIETKLNATRYSVEEIVSNAITIARKAAGNKLVALDIGPTGKLLEPYGELSFQKAYELYAREIKAAVLTGEVDLILIETFFDLMEAKSAIKAAKENSSLPVICTFTFEKHGKTLMGNDIKKVSASLEEFGADAIGINCSLGPREILPLVETMVSSTQLPILVQPNAGLPMRKNGKTVYDVQPVEFAQNIKEMANLGVKWFGGCCGTTPEYIRALREAINL